MKKSRSKTIYYLLLVLTIVIVWEAFASIVSVTKRSPENILPHLHKVILFAVDGTENSSGKTALQVLL